MLLCFGKSLKKCIEMDSETELVEKLISEGKQFDWSNFCRINDSVPGLYAGSDRPEWLTWKTRTKNTIERLCAENSPALILAKRGLNVQTRGNGPEKFNEAHTTFLKALQLTVEALKSDEHGELKGQTSTNVSPKLSNRIFVVHGHDSQLKSDVEQFLSEIGLQPVVLHRQVDQGATIIEKFEKNADVGFAIILLTPDEFAYTSDQKNLKESDRTIESRARPNVIFEFGYFVGKLGRSRVCCIHKGDVTVPSDLNGLLYKKVEESVEAQAFSIIRELKAAGYKVKI